MRSKGDNNLEIFEGVNKLFFNINQVKVNMDTE